MAKYGRFDPRNKKNGRNKYRSLERDIRIHNTEKGNRKKEWVYEDSSDDELYLEDQFKPET